MSESPTLTLNVSMMKCGTVESSSEECDNVAVHSTERLKCAGCVMMLAPKAARRRAPVEVQYLIEQLCDVHAVDHKVCNSVAVLDGKRVFH